jgi:hypothetical protein
LVSGYPALSSAPVSQGQNAADFVAGMQFTVSGLPADLSYSNLNPEGYNTGTLMLSGTPSSSDVGPHVITISADNGVGAPVTQTLILNIASVVGDVNGDGGVRQVHFTGEVTFTVKPGDDFFVQATLDTFVDSRSQQLAADADASHTFDMSFTQGDASLLIPAAPATSDVPEPVTTTLFGIGLAGVGLAMRRRGRPGV